MAICFFCFSAWAGGTKKSTKAISNIENGRKLFFSLACNSCHSTAGKKLVGPALSGGRWGKKIALEKGKKVLFDSQYFRESLLYPKSKLSKGFSPSMPSFKGRISQKGIKELESYLKSIK